MGGRILVVRPFLTRHFHGEAGKNGRECRRICLSATWSEGRVLLRLKQPENGIGAESFGLRNVDRGNDNFRHFRLINLLKTLL